MSTQPYENPLLAEISKLRDGLDRLERWARDMEQAYFTVKYGRKPTASEILMAVCDEWELFDVKQLQQHSNMQRAVEPRHVACYLLRLKLEMSLPAIGQFMGAFHHTTIMHGINKVEERMKCDEPFKERVEKVIQRLK